MLNILPQLTGCLIARHVQISYTAAQDLASLAFWNGLSIRRHVSDRQGDRGRRSVVLRTAGLTFRLERHHDYLELWIAPDGRAPRVLGDVRDMREVLREVRDVMDRYERSRRAWWAVVPLNQYRSIQFQ